MFFFVQEQKIIFIFFQLKALPCIISVPCVNNGNCSNDMTGGYTCSCLTGYIGGDCQIGNTLNVSNSSFLKITKIIMFANFTSVAMRH